MEHNPARLRHARRLLHQTLQEKQMPLWRDAQDHHIHVFLRNLLARPEEFLPHIRQCVSYPSDFASRWARGN